MPPPLPLSEPPLSSPSDTLGVPFFAQRFLKWCNPFASLHDHDLCLAQLAILIASSSLAQFFFAVLAVLNGLSGLFVGRMCGFSVTVPDTFPLCKSPAACHSEGQAPTPPSAPEQMLMSLFLVSLVLGIDKEHCVQAHLDHHFSDSHGRQVGLRLMAECEETASLGRSGLHITTVLGAMSL